MAEKESFVLGLTGNIASGKSAVRQFLENAGAITVDTDLMAQYTYLPSGPAYKPILDAFEPIASLTPKKAPISRKDLGRIVFSDPAALKKLQDIIYPLLNRQIEELIANITKGILVIEGVNLLEAGFRSKLDSLWMTVAEENTRLKRLVEERWMDPADAQSRLRSQVPQAEKAKNADYLIHSDGSFQETYAQVEQGLESLKHLLPAPDWQASPAQFSRLVPELFPQAKSLIFQEGNEEDTQDAQKNQSEALFALLARRSALWVQQGTQTCISIYKLDSGFSLLLASHPQTRDHIEVKTIIAGLSHAAEEHHARALLVPAALLGPAEAKKLGFLPGDSPIKTLQAEVLPLVIRKYGLMPAELYLKLL
ncbi:MAG: dephospho-CoA kinase [Anaerolineaceae bacterium]|nr:dephospho-CoA kinase [Anaerolineaceae bacterium]